MDPQKKKGAEVGGLRALTNHNQQVEFNASSAHCAKWLTVWRYCNGHLSFDGCQAAFRVHSEWRHA